MRAKVLGLSITDLVPRWRNEIDPAHPYLADEAGLCDKYSRMAVGELGTILKDTEELSERRMLAAVLLLGCEDNLLRDALYAQVSIIDVAENLELLRDTAGESFDALVRRDWLRFCENPYLLCSPRLYVKAIREACDSGRVGWSAPARIIFAAPPTASLSIPESLRCHVQKIANSPERDVRL